MNIDHYRRLIAVAELGSFSKAARQLSITQSALTQSIQSLEKTLGAGLFIRNTNGVQLTSFGSELMQRAKLIVSEHARLQDDISNFHSLRATHIDIGVAPYLGNYIFPKAMERFAEEMPDISINIEVEQTDTLARMLRDNSVEVAFCAKSEGSAISDDLDFEVSLNLKLRPMARKGHPIFGKKRIEERDLSKYGWAVYDNERVFRQINSHFEKLDIDPPKFQTPTNSLSMMRTFALSTDTIVLMPTEYAERDIEDGKLKVITPSELQFEMDAGLLYLRNALFSKPTVRLIRLIKNACQELQG